MSMTQEMLEILIGKYLDGEITPSEQCILDEAIENDPDARELLEQLQDLHQQSREVVSSEVLEHGKAVEEIFEQAWPRTKIGQDTPEAGWARENKGVLFKSGFWCGAAGLAAGLVIGLTLHFGLPARSIPKDNLVPEKIITQGITDETDIKDEGAQAFPSNNTTNVSHNVDWYILTDEDGDQWLVEGLRENIVTPAAYSPDL